MLPPYKRAVRKINIRPASNFRLTYSVEGNGYANCTYFTDPEQNEREGWFDRDLLPWGTDTMTPDFTFKRRKASSCLPVGRVSFRIGTALYRSVGTDQYAFGRYE